MSIETGRQNFAIFKRTAQGEFAKQRHQFETGDKTAVDTVVAQVAKRLEVTDVEARIILQEDGWRSRFEESRPKQERDLMAQSSTLGASPTHDAPLGQGGTVSRLGGMRDFPGRADEEE